MSKLVIAYYVTGHGFGHATRVVEVVRELVKAGHEVHVATAAPSFIFTRDITCQPGQLIVRKVVLDSGAVQSDALTVDRKGSLEQFARVSVLPRATLIATEVGWLNTIRADLVVSDIVPIACAAAKEARTPCVCISNFSWDFIYSEYLMAAGGNHRAVVWQIAEDYASAACIFRLPGYTPMPAFRHVVDAPLVVRRAVRSREEVRAEYGIGANQKLLLFNFGGQAASWEIREDYLPEGWTCLICTSLPIQAKLPPNFIRPARDVYVPDLMLAADAILGKIGYGTTSEVT
jgi:L-arabinokinase